MRFRHLILTRFHVRIPEYPEVADSGWLEHRFEIFERFCLPCLRGQSNQNFDWVLLCRSDMPGKFRRRLEDYAGPPHIHAVYLDGDFTQAAAQRVVREFCQGLTHVITTRLDNDDGICRSFVEEIQSHFRGQDFEFLNFANGYVWRDGLIYAGRNGSNPFISLVERAENPSTVYSGNHTNLGDLGPIRQIESPAGWLQVVHGRNLANEAWGRAAGLEEVLEGFAIHARWPPE